MAVGTVRTSPKERWGHCLDPRPCPAQGLSSCSQPAGLASTHRCTRRRGGPHLEAYWPPDQDPPRSQGFSPWPRGQEVPWPGICSPLRGPRLGKTLSPLAHPPPAQALLELLRRARRAWLGAASCALGPTWSPGAALYDDVLGWTQRFCWDGGVTARDAPRHRVWELPAYLGRPLLPAPPWPPHQACGERGGSFECTAWPLSLGLWHLGLRMVAAAGQPSCDHPVLLNFSLLCLHLGGCPCEALDPQGPQPLNPTI